jgi:NAD(P)-dependent dehydrogenase (short-subunit alcohol dehydrogenase family)
MSMTVSDYIIIGASRGLGAALVQELLDRTSCRVYGISRTPLDRLLTGPRWTATGRYEHLAVDIGVAAAVEQMAAFAARGSGRLCVIYNAAHIEKDFLPGGSLDRAAFDRVNAAGINGLRNTLAAFERGLIERGGVFVGVSSFWGRVTPVSLRYVAYPATKAYLDSTLRSLSSLWPTQVQVTAVTIGNIKEHAGTMPAWFIPTYAMAAREIVRRLTAAKTPGRIDYPCWHAVLYTYVLRWMPEGVLRFIFRLYFRLESGAKIPPHGTDRERS